jgi:hypothetical protein
MKKMKKMKKYIKTIIKKIYKKIINKPFKQLIKENEKNIKYAVFLILLNITRNIFLNTDTIISLLNDLYISNYIDLETLYTIYNNIIDLLPFNLPKIIYPNDLPQKEIPIFTESELENKKLKKLKEDVYDKKIGTNFLICYAIGAIIYIIYALW